MVTVVELLLRMLSLNSLAIDIIWLVLFIE